MFHRTSVQSASTRENPFLPNRVISGIVALSVGSIVLSAYTAILLRRPWLGAVCAILGVTFAVMLYKTVRDGDCRRNRVAYDALRIIYDSRGPVYEDQIFSLIYVDAPERDEEYRDFERQALLAILSELADKGFIDIDAAGRFESNPTTASAMEAYGRRSKSVP